MLETLNFMAAPGASAELLDFLLTFILDSTHIWGFMFGEGKPSLASSNSWLKSCSSLCAFLWARLEEVELNSDSTPVIKSTHLGGRFLGSKSLSALVS